MSSTNFILWWYTHGWKVFLSKLSNLSSNITDFFSMDSLIRTLFKPYRQISANTIDENASINRKFNMFIDRLVSRTIGFFSRLILLIIGAVFIIISSFISLILLILWPLIPFTPIIGIILTIIGFTL